MKYWKAKHQSSCATGRLSRRRCFDLRNHTQRLQSLKGEKPLVVSMGNVAASGGYYIASLADEFLQTP